MVISDDKLTEIVIRNMSASEKKDYEDRRENFLKNYEMFKKDIVYRDKQRLCSLRRNKLMKKATKAELLFKDKLDKMKDIKYIFQKGFIKGNFFCFVDFFISGPYGICVEIDGGYHLKENQQVKDKQKDFYLTKERKFKVLRLSNEEAINISLSDLRQLLEIKAITY